MSDTQNEARDALAAFTSSAQWAWGDASLHVGYRSVQGPNDEYWAVCIAQGQLVFATQLGVVGDFSRSERMGSISLRREDVVIVDDGVALLTEEEEHYKGSVHPAILVLTRDGVVRGRVAGRVDRAEAPRRKGGALRVRRKSDHWDPEPVVYVNLTGGRTGGVDAVHAAAEAHGYVGIRAFSLDSRCLAKKAREGASAREVTLLGLPAMSDAERDAVFLAWGERLGDPLPGVLAVLGWIASGDPSWPVVLVLDALTGRPLSERVTKGRSLPATDQRGVADEVSHALECAHGRGRAHGFLWPDRIWLGDGGVRLMDVGLERALAAEVKTDLDPERSRVTGTPWAWAAPEVVNGGRGDARSDVWSFALLVFWMRTGVDYWLPTRDARDVVALATQIMAGPLPLASARAKGLTGVPVEAIDHEFDEWFRLCVVRDPQERFSDLAAARAALPW